ncbi:MAG TPA: DUF348 domain-containing protein [Firmicutes bacterium]|nr:DUF348 domain-containing protein [Bacillota bacterium]
MKTTKISALKSAQPSRLGNYLTNTLVGLVFFLLLLYALQLKTITITVDGAQLPVKTTASTIERALAKAGIPLGPDDEVHPELTARVKEGMGITIRRAVSFSILVDGEEVPVRMPPVPVGEALARTGIELGEGDRLSLSPATVIWEGLRLSVIRVATETVTEEREIEPKVGYINDPNLDKGKQRVVNPGEPGILAVDYSVVYEDGIEVSRTPLGERVVKPAVKKIIAQGTRPVVYTATVGRGKIIRYTDVLTMEATAYEPGPQSCGIYADGYTYTGKKATYGIAAVDPKVIPLGTKLYVEGYGFAAAEDIGSEIKENRIDVCYDTVREALLWGRKKVKVYILAP